MAATFGAPACNARDAHFGGVMSSLEQQIAEAEDEVEAQRQMIARLAAQGREVTAARQQLVAMFENLAFLKKLW
jgi:ABC-type transporter Mla subunit MlaD